MLTTVITIVPRYIIINKLPFKIRISQSKANENVILNQDERIWYNFKNVNKTVEKRLVIADISEGATWSAPFFVEDLDDFQLPYKSTVASTSEEPKWFESTTENDMTRCVRVIIASQDDATLFIYFQEPEMPEYSVHNATTEYITVKIKGTDKDLFKLDVGESKPLIWPEPTSDVKKVVIDVGGCNATYDITSIGKQKVISGPKGVYYHVRNIAKNSGREIIVVESGSKEVSTVESRRQKEQYNKGMLPEELKSMQRIEAKESSRESHREIKKELSSSKPFEETKEVVKVDKNDDKEKSKNGKNKDKAKKEELVEEEKETFSNEDLKVKCVLMGVGISLIDNVPKELIYLSTHELDIQLEKKVVVNEKSHSTTYFVSFNVGHIQIDNMLNKSFPIIFGPHSIFIVDSKKKQKDVDWQPFVQLQLSMNKTKEGNFSFTRFNSIQLQLSEMSAYVDLEILMNLFKVVSSITEVFKPDVKLVQVQQEERKIEYYRPQTVFPSLDSSDPNEPKMDSMTKTKIFIEFLHLVAIKLRVSLRLEKTAVDPTGPLVVLEVLYSVVATLSNISDAPIYFTELIMKNAYSPSSSLIKALQKKYRNQAMFQFYSLLGSIDLIGNPIGLLDKLGSGVFEFFNEPRKGILKGPKEFAKGLGKGVKSLITNVVGGSLNSVSRVTGSLYSLVKNVGGEKVNEDMFRKPDNVITGTLQGLKGGAMEVASGLTGIFTKPFRGAQQEGVVGFFKGVGKGLLGAVTSPVTAALKLGTSVVQGIEGTVVSIGKGGVSQQGRIRFPRYITPTNVLVGYDPSLSEAKLLLHILFSDMYEAENILLFEILKKKENKKEPMIIITEKRFLIISYEKKLLHEVLHSSIKYAQLYSEGKMRYILQVILKDEKKMGFDSIDYATILKCTSYFPEVKPLPAVVPKIK